MDLFIRDLDFADTEYADLGTDDYDPIKIEKAAYDILNEHGYYYHRNSIPIVKLCKKYGFYVIQDNLDDICPKNIMINGDTEKIYNHNKVILVSGNTHKYNQRFYAAHELAHYLFDYPNDTTFGTERLYEDNYIELKKYIPENRADKFALSILMPQELFFKQLNIAKTYFTDSYLIYTYLSRFFEVPMESILLRIKEVSQMVGQVNV